MDFIIRKPNPALLGAVDDAGLEERMDVAYRL
jgi:hypothetical protein